MMIRNYVMKRKISGCTRMGGSLIQMIDFKVCQFTNGSKIQKLYELNNYLDKVDFTTKVKKNILARYANSLDMPKLAKKIIHLP